MAKHKDRLMKAKTLKEVVKKENQCDTIVNLWIKLCRKQLFSESVFCQTKSKAAK